MLLAASRVLFVVCWLLLLVVVCRLRFVVCCLLCVVVYCVPFVVGC